MHTKPPIQRFANGERVSGGSVIASVTRLKLTHTMPTIKSIKWESNAIMLTWFLCEIVALHVIEVDTMTASVTILQLEHESGHYLEIHELDKAFSTAFQDLASFLTTYDEDWTSGTRGLEPGTTATIWRRR